MTTKPPLYRKIHSAVRGKTGARSWVAVAVILLVSVGGTAAVLLSHAATAGSAVEAEAGSLAGAVAKENGTTASGGSYIKFGATSTHATPVKLMPLGDSITDGFTTVGGYRTVLWQKLVQTDNDNIDFVGSVTSGPSTLGDKNHEGHSGWCAGGTYCGNNGKFLTNGIDGWLTTYKPDIITLHIGTNDIGNGSSAAEVTARLDSLLTKIYANRPNVIVIVAKIVSMHGYYTQVDGYNNAIPGLATKYQNQGRKMQVVDMSYLTAMSDFDDGWHPNASGQAKMAATWYPAVTAAYNSL